jgi:hypothetical protein
MRTALTLLALGGLLVGCGPQPEPAQDADPTDATPPAGAAAVWTLADRKAVTGSSTRFVALVTRLECNSGVTGEVAPPGVRVTDTEVVVTFAVEPRDAGAADCQGNDQVPYDVLLDEPLGGRTLVDGQCKPGAEAATTSFCRDGGTRWEPEG